MSLATLELTIVVTRQQVMIIQRKNNEYNIEKADT